MAQWVSEWVSQSVSESVTRSPIELFWTAKKPVGFQMRPYAHSCLEWLLQQLWNWQTTSAIWCHAKTLTKQSSMDGGDQGQLGQCLHFYCLMFDNLTDNMLHKIRNKKTGAFQTLHSSRCSAEQDDMWGTQRPHVWSNNVTSQFDEKTSQCSAMKNFHHSASLKTIWPLERK